MSASRMPSRWSIKDAAGKAVTDLNDGDLKVTVSIGGQTSDALDLLNTFDPDTGLGVPGDYEAPIMPTAPGDYTFHLTGSIHGTAVDETATSSDATFNSVVDGDRHPVPEPAAGPDRHHHPARPDRCPPGQPGAVQRRRRPELGSRR